MLFPNLKNIMQCIFINSDSYSNIKMLKLLLKQGARLKDTDELGFNALDYAMENKKIANVTFLRSMGLKPNIQH
jgi:ankyrin repeat protein